MPTAASALEHKLFVCCPATNTRVGKCSWNGDASIDGSQTHKQGIVPLFDIIQFYKP